MRRSSATGSNTIAGASRPSPSASLYLELPAEIGGVVLIIDAKNDRAARWHASYGAVPLSGKPLTLVTSLASFAADLQEAGQL
jgi:hypothetical protein